MTPALLTSRCSGPFQASTNVATDAWSDRSILAIRTFGLPVVAMMSAATGTAVSVLCTASVISAPQRASARAVSIPMPDAPPVTIARLPERTMPLATSAAVDRNPNGVVIRVSGGLR